MKVGTISRMIRSAKAGNSCGAVLVAAGSASRMQGVDKIMADLGGEPLILRTLRAFQNAVTVGEIVVVTREDLLEEIAGFAQNAGIQKLSLVISGGSTRQESVEKGLAALSDSKWVAVADGARPLISSDLIDRVVRAAQTHGAAAPAIPVKDTIKETKQGFMVSTPDRSKLRAVQTPQVFDYDVLCGALAQARKDHAQLTDDCSAVERLGMPVCMVEGEERNFKVTTQLDLLLARTLLQEEQL